MNRQAILDNIRQSPNVTVLIIGAGVNGIGTFRDLALQGVDVLLVDRGDFCAETSATSSRMLHGGLRYLENGEFRLVREALKERNLLLKNAPHYAHPLPTTVPIYRWLSGMFNAPLKFLGLISRPAERGAVVIKIGLMLYDAYVRGQSPMPEHHFASREESLRQWPDINPEILCTATYYDGMMPRMEQFCIDLIRDAEEGPARAVNYVSAVDGGGETVTLRDELTGETFVVRPKIVVNAAGPWIDFVNRAMGRPTEMIGGTKGSHIVVDHPGLRQAIGGHEFLFENRDGRVVLIYPLLDKVLIGSTDIRVDDPDQARCTDEEIDYILGMIPLVFPHLNVGREHIVYTICGVRPLPRSGVGFTGQISRDHSTEVIEAGVTMAFPILSLVGGKWTTYRAFAEQVTDNILKRLGRARTASTADLPIGGGRDYPRSAAQRADWLAALAGQTGLPSERLDALLDRYGTRAQEVAAYIAAGEDTPLSSRPDYSRREIVFLAEHDWIAHLDDLLLRRLTLGILGEVTADLVKETAGVLGESLGWDADRCRAEVARVAGILADQHGVSQNV